MDCGFDSHPGYHFNIRTNFMVCIMDGYRKGDLVISAGIVYCDKYSRWVATVEGGKVIEFNKEVMIAKEDRDRIESFADEAYRYRM